MQLEQKHIEVVVTTPASDTDLLWWSGIIVPVVLAAVGWFVHWRKG